MKTNTTFAKKIDSQTHKTRVYKKTQKCVKTNSLSVYYKGIDYLTVRISDKTELAQTLYWLVENSNTYVLKDGIHITYFWNVNGNRLKVLHVLSETSQIIATIHLKLPKPNDKKTVYSDIEFTGLFFTSYSDLLPYFFELFEINPHTQKIVSRIDYCIDFQWINAHDFSKRYSRNQKKTKEVKVRGITTWYYLKSDRHEIAVYNKMLDIIDKKKYEIVARWELPYACYKNADQPPITRIEYRKNSKGIKELADSSLNSLFEHIHQYAIDHFEENFSFSFSYLLGNERKPFPEKRTTLWVNWEKDDEYFSTARDLLVAETIQQKKDRSRIMYEAYMDSYTSIASRDDLFRSLFQRYWTELLMYGFRLFEDEPLPVSAFTAFELEMIFTQQAQEF